ncbi:MAG TPA: glycosyltransferase family 4 protein [Candidatus Limnocylindria bacterium]|nr:glycosyltransferase family 4 protein [Candidatus Limnocylindria bacterium]
MILYLRTDLSNRPLKAGGSVAHTLGVVRGFLELGHSVVCASSVMQEQLRNLPVTDFCKLENPRILRFMRWRLNCVLSNIFFTLRMLALFKRHHFTTIYQRYSIFNGVGVLLSKLKKVPLILEYNGSEVWIDKHWGGPSQFFHLRRLAHVLEQWNLRYAHTIVVVSEVLRDELVARGVDPAKIVINPNGVDTAQFDPARLVEQRTFTRQQFAVENLFVFCFVGTFSPWHGVNVLARMIPEVIKQRSHARFLLIGDGPLVPWLKAELTKAQVPPHAVMFTGLIPQQEIHHYLAAADAFLCPTQPNPDGSRFFGSPTKLFEYMSMGKPIIASDIEQVAEILKGIGTLVLPNDIQGFVQAACVLVDEEPDHRLQRGNQVRAQAIARHQWKHHVQRCIEGRL